MRAAIIVAITFPALTACERTGPCAAYDRAAENHKDEAQIRYCVDRKGRAVGPYTCDRDDGRGRVRGQFRDGKRHGTWTFTADGGALVRREQWRQDRKSHGEEFHPELPPLPEDVKSIACDGHILRRARR